MHQVDKVKYATTAIILFLISAPIVARSQNQNPTLTLHAQSHEVVLQVTVRDKHGNLVPTLDKGDFTLTEDGRAQVIKSLAIDPAVPMRIGLLVDTSRHMMSAMESERKAADKFIDTMLPAEPKSPQSEADQAFLIHFDHEVELLRDFTTSREKLHAELDNMGPTSRSRDDREGPETTDNPRERPRGGPGTTQLYDAIYLASNEVLKRDPGVRNVLVVFSDGVDGGSKVTLNEALDAADKANAVIYAVFLKGERSGNNFGFPGSGRQGGIGGGWPGGGGYPGGGYPGGGRSEGRPSVDGRKIMEEIAKRTGGRYFDTKKKDDLDQIYGLIAQELRGQYLLTYTPDKEDNDGGYHKVVLTCKKSDWSVMIRQGYFAPGDDTK